MKKVLALVAMAMMLSVLASCAGGSQQSSEAQSTQADSVQAQSASSEQVGGSADEVVAAKNELVAFASSDVYQESNDLIQEIGKLDVATLVVNGDYETFASYKKKLESYRDRLPEYTGKNGRIAQLYDLYSKVLEADIDAVDNAGLAASSAAIGDADTMKKYVVKSSESASKVSELFKQLTALVNVINDEYDAVNGS